MPLSLQCPRCNGAVSIADQAAGQRVKCPHCEQTFLAPGVSSSENDDDDWLKLDDDPVAPKKTTPKKATPKKAAPKQASTPAKPATPENPKSKSGKVPSLSSDDEALLAEFAADLDEFTAEIEALPEPHPSSPAVQGAGAAGPTPFRGPAGATGGAAAVGGAGAKTPSRAEAVEYATEYRVTCKICGSLLYVKANQAGKTLKCGDCYSPITVPPPPKVRKGSALELDAAPTFSLEQSKTGDLPPDPYKKSADQLLEEATVQEAKQPEAGYDDTPSVKEWFKNVFGIFIDIGVLAHWIGLSVLATIPAVIALSMEQPVFIMGLFPAGLFLGVIVVSCGFAILQAVANQEERVSEWPTLDPIAWFGQLFTAVSAAMLAAIPVWALCHFTIGSQLFSVAATMFAVYALFPFVLLSMLDMNTVMMPFSPEVARSVTKCEEAWGGFYFSSGLLFIGLFLVISMASTMSPTAGACIAIPATIGIAFCFFSMIGRLAFAIGQAINAPPMKNDVERSSNVDTV